MLRTGFVSLEGADTAYAMVVHRVQNDKLSRNVEHSHSDFDLLAWRAENVKRFHDDLLQPPWAAAIQMVDDRPMMHISIFHALYDATSLTIILDALESQLHNRPIEQSSGVSGLLPTILESALYSDEERENFWKTALEGATHNAFPDLNPLHVSKTETQKVEHTIDVDLATIEASCRAHEFSMQAVGQSAWARVLSAYLGEAAVIIGIVLSGRDATVKAGQVAFPCLVTLPFAASLETCTNQELVQAAMSWNASVRSHQFTRLSDIKRWTSMNVMFDTIFAYQKFPSRGGQTKLEVIDEVASDEVWPVNWDFQHQQS